METNHLLYQLFMRTFHSRNSFIIYEKLQHFFDFKSKWTRWVDIEGTQEQG